VIAGGFRLESVEDICAGEALARDEILDTLASLVDKSLIMVQSGATFTRYRLLDTVRQYAREKLEAAGEYEFLRERHAQHFLSLAEAAAPHLIGGAGVPYWMDRLLEDADDLRLVAEWAEEKRERVAVTLRMGAAVQWLLFAQGWFQEGRDRLTRALAIAQDVDPYTHAIGSTALAAICLWQGDTAKLPGLLQHALPVLRESSDRSTYAYALSMLGGAITQEGNPAAAAPLLDQAVAAAREQTHPVLLAIALYWRGLTARARGEFELARTSFEEAVSIGRALNNLPSIGHPLTALARVLVQRNAAGDIAAAQNMLFDALKLHRQSGDRWGLAWTLETLAAVSSCRDEEERATRLLAGAESLREIMGAPRPPAERPEIEAMLEKSRSSLGRPRFDDAWREARALPLEEVLDHAVACAECVGSSPTAAQVDARIAADLDVRALGPLIVQCAGRDVVADAWPSSKARELLVFLLCQREGVTREQVGLALWPDASSAQLRNSFHVTLHRLRKALADATWVELAGERYRIAPTIRVEFDAQTFERAMTTGLRQLRAGGVAVDMLRSALALYRGDFLAGERVGDWHLQQRDYLQRLYRDGLRALAAFDAERGDYAEAAALYHRLLAVEELDEDAGRGLISCTLALGDRAGALRIYERLRQRLQDELDADPEPETTALLRRTIDA
jgi:DNA-binding SARP family transcriptional activator